MTPPSLRVTYHRKTEFGEMFVWDLRIAQPNVSHIAMPVAHSIEHFLGSYFSGQCDRVLNFGPMGCQTGFYIVTAGLGDFDEMAALLRSGLESILTATEVPLANPVQCGWAENHSLEGAQRVAAWLLLHSGD